MEKETEKQQTPIEKAIYDAIQEVEKLPASVKLTDAVNLLAQAKDLVSDFIDENQSQEQN